VISAPVTAVDGVVIGPHGPIPVRRYSPPAGVPGAATSILWVHGGAFMWGGLDQPESDAVARGLAAAGFPVVTLAYRLGRFPPFRSAPAAPPGALPARGNVYPVPVDDVETVVRAVATESAGGMIVGGASAGACLAAGALTRLRDTATGDTAAAHAVRGAFFVYGLFHGQFPQPPREIRSRLAGRRRYTNTPRTITLTNLNYAGTREALQRPDAFPGGHALAGFPPSLFIDADHDIMRASGSLFARELSAVGVPVDYRMMAHAHHAFLDRPNDPAWAPSIAAIVEWVRGMSQGPSVTPEDPPAQTR
jgi:acetyl esterase